MNEKTNKCGRAFRSAFGGSRFPNISGSKFRNRYTCKKDNEGKLKYTVESTEPTYQIIQDLGSGCSVAALVERYERSGRIDVAGFTIPNNGFLDTTVLSSDPTVAYQQLKGREELIKSAMKETGTSSIDQLAAVILSKMQIDSNNAGNVGNPSNTVKEESANG